MDKDRRHHERYPSFKDIELVAVDAHGTKRQLSLTARDRSLPGIGGVYIGQAPPSSEEEYLFAEDGTTRRLRLAWRSDIAEYVSIVGFEFLDE